MDRSDVDVEHRRFRGLGARDRGRPWRVPQPSMRGFVLDITITLWLIRGFLFALEVVLKGFSGVLAALASIVNAADELRSAFRRFRNRSK